MLRFLRKSWLTLAIIICAAAFIPLVIGFVNHDANHPYDQTLLAIGISIFMGGIVFALVCVVLVLISSMTKKRSTKA